MLKLRTKDLYNSNKEDKGGEYIFRGGLTAAAVSFASQFLIGPYKVSSSLERGGLAGQKKKKQDESRVQLTQRSKSPSFDLNAENLSSSWSGINLISR